MPSGSGSKPAPDYQGAAQQQFQSGQQTWQQQQAANRPDQTNAFGTSSTWSQDPSGNWSQQTSLGGGLGQYAGALQDQLGSQGAFNGGGQHAFDQAYDAAYGQQAKRLDTQFGQRDESQRAQLAAQGLTAGDAAYDNAMKTFSDQRNDAYDSAARGATQAGFNGMGQMFNQNLAQYQLPLQQLAAMNQFTGQQGFLGAGQAQALQALPAAQAQGNYQLQQQQQDAQNAGGFWGGLGSLGGAAIGFGFGGPAGGMLGQKIGSTAGGMA